MPFKSRPILSALRRPFLALVTVKVPPAFICVAFFRTERMPSNELPNYKIANNVKYN